MPGDLSEALISGLLCLLGCSIFVWGVIITSFFILGLAVVTSLYAGFMCSGTALISGLLCLLMYFGHTAVLVLVVLWLSSLVWGMFLGMLGLVMDCG